MRVRISLRVTPSPVPADSGDLAADLLAAAG